MLGPVVVEVTAASPEAAQVEAMLEACSRAVGRSPCVQARQAPEPPYAAVAIVTVAEDGHARVEVGLRSGDHSQWRSRELVFQEADLELERWRAIGFVVGTLASAVQEDSASEPPIQDVTPATPATPAAPPSPPKPASPAPEAAQRAAAARPGVRLTWLGLGWYGGDGLDAELERNGAWGRVGVRPSALPIIAFASLSYGTATRAPSGLTASWLEAGLGLGLAAIDNRSLALDFELDGSGQRFSAEANQVFLGSSGRARWLGVLRLRPELSWYWSDAVGAAAFGELSLRGGTTRVRVAERDVGETSRLGYAFGLGLCVRALR